MTEKIAIKICSDKPGTGLSTSVDNLIIYLKQNNYSVERILSGGKIMRSMAHDYLKQKYSITDYINLFKNLINDQDKLLKYLNNILINDNEHNENELASFQKALENSNNPDTIIFDKITDLFPILMLNVMEPGIAVVDAKIAVLLENLGPILGFELDSAVKIINFLLTVDEEISNLRVLLRELRNNKDSILAKEVEKILNSDNPDETLKKLAFSKEITQKLKIIQQLNAKRVTRDWSRYRKAYNISPKDLRKNVPKNNIIDTTYLTPSEILKIIIKKI